MVVGVLLALAIGESSPTSTVAAPPRLGDVLALAGRYVARLEEDLAVLVAEETYEQRLYVGLDDSTAQRRTLVADVVWVPTGDAFVWAFFRDVREVEGTPVRDRQARLEQLFPEGMTPTASRRALEILAESSRYNLGRQRTVNSPTIALTFLHPRNQSRFSFHLVGPDEKEGLATWKVRFDEKARPTLTRTSRLEDVPARGLLWVEVDGGALVASRLELRAPRGIGPIAIETTYARDDRMGFWLPRQMRETYGNQQRQLSDERVEALARYSGWRRAQVELLPIVPVR